MFSKFFQKLEVLRGAWRVYTQQRTDLSRRGTAWESMILAASEELLDESDLSATIPLPAGVTFEDVTDLIIERARAAPDLDSLITGLSGRFMLSRSHSITAIDRTLGGIVRAASKCVDVSPDRDRDPFAWHAFQRASAEPRIVDDIYPGWKLPNGISRA